MKRIISICVILALILAVAAIPASAEEGNVVYDGVTQNFIFQPGSDYSLTDLFPNFKDVMPGDSLTQPITVRNESDNHVKVEIYIRSLGANPGSEDFLSQLNLRVAVAEDNIMGYMFDAYANETAQLTDWVCLGMLYSGGEVDLEVTLDVPVTLDNAYQEQVGYLTWEFMVIEYPVEPDDPEPPKTGDDFELALPFVMMGLCAVALIILVIWRKKDRGGKSDEE
jgi:hypothetical protein